MPRYKPDIKVRSVHWAVLVLAALFLGSLTAAILGLDYGGADASAGSPAAIPYVLWFAILFGIREVRYGRAVLKQRAAAQERIGKIESLYNQLYYCARCDAVFGEGDSETHTPADLERLLSL